MTRFGIPFIAMLCIKNVKFFQILSRPQKNRRRQNSLILEICIFFGSIEEKIRTIKKTHHLGTFLVLNLPQEKLWKEGFRKSTNEFQCYETFGTVEVGFSQRWWKITTTNETFLFKFFGRSDQVMLTKTPSWQNQLPHWSLRNALVHLQSTNDSLWIRTQLQY